MTNMGSTGEGYGVPSKSGTQHNAHTMNNIGLMEGHGVPSKSSTQHTAPLNQTTFPQPTVVQPAPMSMPMPSG